MELINGHGSITLLNCFFRILLSFCSDFLPLVFIATSLCISHSYTKSLNPPTTSEVGLSVENVFHFCVDVELINTQFHNLKWMWKWKPYSALGELFTFMYFLPGILMVIFSQLVWVTNWFSRMHVILEIYRLPILSRKTWPIAMCLLHEGWYQQQQWNEVNRLLCIQPINYQITSRPGEV